MQYGIIHSQYTYKRVKWIEPSGYHNGYSVVEEKEEKGDPRPLLQKQNGPPYSRPVKGDDFNFLAQNTTTGAKIITSRGRMSVVYKPHNEDLADSRLIRFPTRSEQKRENLDPKKYLKKMVQKTEETLIERQTLAGAAAAHTLLRLNAQGKVEASTAVLGDCRVFAVEVDLRESKDLYAPAPQVNVTPLTPELHGLGSDKSNPLFGLSDAEVARLLDRDDIAFAWNGAIWYISGPSFRYEEKPKASAQTGKTKEALLQFLKANPPPAKLYGDQMYHVWWHDNAWQTKTCLQLSNDLLNMTHSYNDARYKPIVSAEPALNTTELAPPAYHDPNKLQFVWESTDGIDLSREEIIAVTREVVRTHGQQYKELFARKGPDVADDFMLDQLALALDARAENLDIRKEQYGGDPAKDNRTGQITSYRRVKKNIWILNTTTDGHGHSAATAEVVCEVAPRHFVTALEADVSFSVVAESQPDPLQGFRNEIASMAEEKTKTGSYSIITKYDSASKNYSVTSRKGDPATEQNEQNDNLTTEESKENQGYLQTNRSTQTGMVNIGGDPNTKNLTYIKTGNIFSGAMLEPQQWQEVFTEIMPHVHPTSVDTETKALADLSLAVIHGSQINIHEEKGENCFYLIILRKNGAVGCERVSKSINLNSYGLSEGDHAFLIATNHPYHTASTEAKNAKDEIALRTTVERYFDKTRKAILLKDLADEPGAAHADLAVSLMDATRGQKDRPPISVAVTSIQPHDYHQTKYLMMATGKQPDDNSAAYHCYCRIHAALERAVYPRACVACEQEIERLEHADALPIYKDRGESLRALWAKGCEFQNGSPELITTRRATMELAAQTKCLVPNVRTEAIIPAAQDAIKQKHNKLIATYASDHLPNPNNNNKIITVILRLIQDLTVAVKQAVEASRKKLGAFFHDAKVEQKTTADPTKFYKIKEEEEAKEQEKRVHENEQNVRRIVLKHRPTR